MPSTRTINTLVEAWPDHPANFELQAFAASLVDDRPALGAPALARIEAQLAHELDRRSQPPRASSSGLCRLAGSIAPAGRLIAPYAAAACLLVGVDIWLNGRMSGPTPAPLHPNGSLITDQPSGWQPAEPEDPARVPRPAPQDG